MTSDTPAQRMITAGCRSKEPFQIKDRVIARISGADDVPAESCLINLHRHTAKAHRWSVSIDRVAKQV